MKKLSRNYYAPECQTILTNPSTVLCGSLETFYEREEIVTEDEEI